VIGGSRQYHRLALVFGSPGPLRDFVIATVGRQGCQLSPGGAGSAATGTRSGDAPGVRLLGWRDDNKFKIVADPTPETVCAASKFRKGRAFDLRIGMQQPGKNGAKYGERNAKKGVEIPKGKVSPRQFSADVGFREQRRLALGVAGDVEPALIIPRAVNLCGTGTSARRTSCRPR